MCWWEGVVTLHSLLRTGFTDRLPELPALPSQHAKACRRNDGGRQSIFGRLLTHPAFGAREITPSIDEVIVFEADRAVGHGVCSYGRTKY